MFYFWIIVLQKPRKMDEWNNNEVLTIFYHRNAASFHLLQESLFCHLSCFFDAQIVPFQILIVLSKLVLSFSGFVFFLSMNQIFVALAGTWSSMRRICSSCCQCPLLTTLNGPISSFFIIFEHMRTKPFFCIWIFKKFYWILNKILI